MRHNVIKNLYKKEILDVLRDKKTVIMMLVVPLVLYPLLFIVGLQLMSGVSASMAEHTYRIVLDFEDADGVMEKLFREASEDGYSFAFVQSENPEEQLKDESIDVYIEKNEKNGKECFDIYYASAVTNSNYAAGMVEEILNTYQAALIHERVEAAGLSADQVLNPIDVQYVDMSGNEESAGSLLGMVLPFMLVISLLLGTMYPAIDTTAGERERGTLETVLTLPVLNRELIISKFLTVATIGVVSAVLNIIAMCGVGVYMYHMMLSVSDSVNGIDMERFVPTIIIGVLCVLAFAVFISAVTMCVCAFAKSYKEANNYITPLTLVVMFASFIGFFPNVTLTSNMALVPVANICLLIRDLLAFKIDIGIIAIVLVSNVAYGIVAIMFLGRIYNSETILFGDGANGVQIFERRSNMVKGGVPTPGDAWLVAAVTVVAILYLGGTIQVSYGYYGVLATQLILLGIPLLAAVYSKKSLRKTFRLNAFCLRHIAGSIVMIIGAILVGIVLTAVTSAVFPSSAEGVSVSMDYLMGNNFAQTLLVVALLPAVCEELMFRGYIFSAFEAKMKPAAAIFTASVIFGLYHMSIVRFFTTMLLGTVICYVAYRSKSIFPGMLMHFINNACSVFTVYYPEQTKRLFPVLVKETVDMTDMLLMLAAGIVCLAAGALLTGRKPRETGTLKED